MATLHQVQAALQGVVQTALVGVVPSPAIGIGWPPETLLMDNVRTGGAGLITIYDRKLSKDTTRWKPLSLGQTIVQAGVISIATQGNANASITLSGTVLTGDAVSCILTLGQTQSAVVAIAQVGATLISLALALANAVNADSLLSTWAQASASGAVVTLVPLLPFRVASYTGNGGTETLELGRRMRRMQIVIWANSEPLRQTLSDPVEVAIAQLEVGYGPYPQGLSFVDGTVGRVLAESDYYIEESTLFDTYRRDFLLSVDYPITSTDVLYAVVAPILTMTPNQL